MRRRSRAARTLPARAAAGLMCVCALFATAATGIGIAGIVGVRSTTDTGKTISNGELTTATATTAVSRAIDRAYATGAELVFAAGTGARPQLATTLVSNIIPAADTAIASLVALHSDDPASEQADIQTFTAQWANLRDLLVRIGLNPQDQPAAQLNGLHSTFASLDSHIGQLTSRENDDAHSAQRHADATFTYTLWTIGSVVGLTLIGAVALAWFGIRRIRLALRPEERQAEFADTMQLADDELEAHSLLKRHLERAVPHSTVTVLNRNNSADRLEAVTPIAPASCLTRTLQHAAPRSCLAVRSGRTHRETGGVTPLLGCSVCGECAGSSMCTPLTVGGEVIGSVLVNASQSPTSDQSQRVHTSVGQAAPILANLRNLAIAEVRAATDALTGLPNKRAVDDTLKRMLAQASRTLSPLALILLDLDHFKNINDRLGHPIGDQALASVGAALTSTLRESDFAGRSGGEEFALVLPNTDLEGATQLAEKIRATIADIHLPGTDATLTASLGVALYPDHATSTDHLERLADAALYVAKRSGRNRTEIAVTGDTSRHHVDSI